MRRPIRCHNCGCAFDREPGADLYCSMKCALEAADANLEVARKLKDAGFRQNKEAPNLWEKDGVHITVEECKQHGVENVLERHKRLVAVPKLRDKKPAD